MATTPKFTPPVIGSSKPTDVPATPAATYDQYRMLRLVVNATDPTLPVRVAVVLQKARTLPSGVQELSPVDSPVQLSINDLGAAATQDPDLATLYAGVLATVEKYAKAQGKIS